MKDVNSAGLLPMTSRVIAELLLTSSVAKVDFRPDKTPVRCIGNCTNIFN